MFSIFNKIDINNIKPNDLEQLNKAYISFNSEVTGKKQEQVIEKVQTNLKLINDGALWVIDNKDLFNIYSAETQFKLNNFSLTCI